MSKDGLCRSINRRLAEVNGVSVEDTIGKTLREVLPSPFAEEVEQYYQSVYDTGWPVGNFEIVGRTSASDAKRTAKALKDKDDKLQAFITDAPVMMGLVEIPADDSDILHLMDNHATEQFLDLGRGETAGMWAVADLGLPENDRDEWIANYRKAKATGKAAHFIYAYDHIKQCDDNPQEHCCLNATVSYYGPGDEGRERFC